MEDPVNLYLNLEQWRESGYGDDLDDPITSSSSSSSSSPPSSEFFMVGFVIVNVVGLRFYSGRISGREMVGLVREPLNPYDPNAIKVLNMRAVQVGHIERSSSAVLAPLIDDGSIIVEGIVPNTPGAKSKFKLSCQVHIFSNFDALSSIERTISRSGLMFISSSEPLASLSESAAIKEKKDKKEIRSIDEIFNLVGADEDKKDAKFVVDPPKNVIKSDLFLHQKEGLGWLVHRENCEDMPPFWEEKDGVFKNVLTNYHTDKRPEPLRGGIFADDMGLGKTLTLLSLIATNRPGTASSSSLHNGGEEQEEEEIGTKTKGKRDKKIVGSRKKHKIGNTLSGNKEDVEFCSKTTLVVCPPVVFSTWITQLEEHTKRGSFKVYMYYKERTEDVKELQKFDLVLTTYSTLAAEANWEGSPMKKMEWFRVILDEAHVIKNAEAQQSKAVMALKAKRRWVVTGTPIQNGSLDLFSLMAFLKFEPFSIKNYWLSLVQRPLSQGNESGLSRLQILMATISLRRVKDNTLVGLPPKTIETCFVELSAQERDLYDQIEFEAKNLVQAYMRVGSVMRNFSTVLTIILRLRQICDDATLYPDIKSLLPTNNIEDVSNNPELLQKLVAMLQDGDDFDCPICICPPINTVITRCAHIFCRACILKALKRPIPNCPLCRQTLSESDLFSAPPEPSDCESTVVPSKETSSKVAALLKLLVEDRKQHPSTKSVIFSQFRKMLILLEEPLKASGFMILRLDGSMTAKKRAEVIKEFSNQESGTPTVLLAGLKASGAGINLTVASRVYLLEPWWNPAVEEQAMDRVHRIGQKNDVKIVRLITRNSIEERILELQEKKKVLAREAFGKKGSKDSRQIGTEDLRVLMALIDLKDLVEIGAEKGKEELHPRHYNVIDTNNAHAGEIQVAFTFTLKDQQMGQTTG
ncbi:Dna repair protein rad5 [Thalictrum thalictroides]|uniref:Dna repair protein rad5 n=1 Tax=Thalictrum thalictroides TaxID=46969 RepID=A0A7J6UZK3_THATH|nr:Dna repair protein rad5 [Thalictrum thalictroides]